MKKSYLIFVGLCMSFFAIHSMQLPDIQEYRRALSCQNGIKYLDYDDKPEIIVNFLEYGRLGIGITSSTEDQEYFMYLMSVSDDMRCKLTYVDDSNGVMIPYLNNSHIVQSCEMILEARIDHTNPAVLIWEGRITLFGTENNGTLSRLNFVAQEIENNLNMHYNFVKFDRIIIPGQNLYQQPQPPQQKSQRSCNIM